MKINSQIAECVGLWLAEGDNKTKTEITFTNNCWDLVKHFHNTLMNLFNPKNVRLYVYSKDKTKINIPLNNVMVKYYIDKRARKPYFIWRFASVKLTKEWKKSVENIKNKSEFYDDILRGFFAGEGSVNYRPKNNNHRSLRISQGQPNKFIEKILDYLDIEYKFKLNNRNYDITHRDNIKKLYSINIAGLHPDKLIKLNKLINSYKQRHYKRGHLKNLVLSKLINPFTSKELSELFNRSQCRITEVLTGLEKDKLINRFKVRSTYYWILSNTNKIIISDVKYSYLCLLEKALKRVKNLSIEVGVCNRSTSNRLNELKTLNLVRRNEDKLWYKLPTTKEIIVK